MQLVEQVGLALQHGHTAVQLWAALLDGSQQQQSAGPNHDQAHGAVCRLPDAALQAALQLAQLLQLHGAGDTAAACQILAQLVGALAAQVGTSP